MSGLLLWVGQPSAGEPQGVQLAELLAIGNEWADDGHRPLDAVDRQHLPERHGYALLVQESLQPRVVQVLPE
jgi:hypothetical protein